MHAVDAVKQHMHVTGPRLMLLQRWSPDLAASALQACAKDRDLHR